MKKIIGIAIVIFISASISFAQQGLKIGHINTQELLQAMPETDSAQLKLEKMQKELQSQLEVMQVELNNKYQDYLSKRDSYSELVRQTKEDELQNIQQRIQQFAQNADQDLQEKRNELYRPILDKANKAIEEVAKENGFTYILDLSSGVVLFHSDSSLDILPLVKAKLKLK
ncbi:MAG TPA: OmpH family outer membrane protein [Bacteroidales bacterium]|nr:OmpH family outer membrane protein [Bacteroidales bacterium]HOK99024.1 OmpH family outer membrane protein [Bacteroidales bacterium]HPO65853.1 OmpH family outer membrane protein [Bacteroidales bacterium]